MTVLADQHPCCRIIGDEQCCLWCGHDGEHLPYVPGDYLSEPILHPLDLWRVFHPRGYPKKRCPICGAAGGRWGLGFGVEIAGLISRQMGDEIHLSTESIWRFEPCGCTGREILPDPL